MSVPILIHIPTSAPVQPAAFPCTMVGVRAVTLTVPALMTASVGKTASLREKDHV